jgi:hypothetical protein
MAFYEEAIARDVHDLLLSADPETIDKVLASAAKLANVDRDAAACQNDDFRMRALSAIKDLRNAVDDGARYSERKRLLFHAANSARSWVNARRFSNFLLVDTLSFSPCAAFLRIEHDLQSSNRSGLKRA